MRRKRMFAAAIALVVIIALSAPVYAAGADYGPLPDSGVITFSNPSSESYTFGPENNSSKNSTPSSNGQTIITVDGEAIPYGTQFTSGYIIAKDGSVSRFDPQSVADEIFRLSNIERVNAGVGEVERRTDLDELASKRAKELAVSFGHTRPDGSSYTSIADERGISYKYIGENAGRLGNGTATTMINNWMNSEGHCSNMLNPKHTGLGVGVYKDGQTVYFIQMFIYE